MSTRPPNSIVHNFANSKASSLDLVHEPAWIAFYREIWPTAVSIVRVDKNCAIQASGIDRLIWLECGKQITVDEKLRRGQYADILLELVSVGQQTVRGFETQKIGWAVDPTKCCDYVAYAVPRLGKCYLLPFSLLRITVESNLESWIEHGRARGIVFPVDAQNAGYTTRNIAVPWPVLSEAMTSQMQRSFGVGEVQPLPPSQRQQGINQIDFHWDVDGAGELAEV